MLESGKEAGKSWVLCLLCKPFFPDWGLNFSWLSADFFLRSAEFFLSECWIFLLKIAKLFLRIRMNYSWGSASGQISFRESGSETLREFFKQGPQKFGRLPAIRMLVLEILYGASNIMPISFKIRVRAIWATCYHAKRQTSFSHLHNWCRYSRISAKKLTENEPGKGCESLFFLSWSKFHFSENLVLSKRWKNLKTC